MRISDWSSDVCSSDLQNVSAGTDKRQRRVGLARCHCRHDVDARIDGAIVVRRPAHEGEDRAWTEGDDARAAVDDRVSRSEEHTSELQSLMRISYAVFCLKKKITNKIVNDTRI